MRILNGFYSVYWTRKGWKQQFQADIPATSTPAQAVRAFLALFPDDIVLSVRDSTGRFLKFK